VLPGSNPFAPVFNDTQLQIYGDALLDYQRGQILPKFMVGGSGYDSHGQFVFWNNDGSNLFVIVKADTTSNLLSPYAVAIANPLAGGEPCTYAVDPPLVNALNGGGSFDIKLMTSPICAWTSSADSPWITVRSANGIGTATVSFSTTANNTGSPRMGSVTVA